MKEMREAWCTRLQKMREERYMTANAVCREMGLNPLTYQRLMDPAKPNLSQITMWKIRDYFKKLDEKEANESRNQ